MIWGSVGDFLEDLATAVVLTVITVGTGLVITLVAVMLARFWGLA